MNKNILNLFSFFFVLSLTVLLLPVNISAQIPSAVCLGNCPNDILSPTPSSQVTIAIPTVSTATPTAVPTTNPTQSAACQPANVTNANPANQTLHARSRFHASDGLIQLIINFLKQLMQLLQQILGLPGTNPATPAPPQQATNPAPTTAVNNPTGTNNPPAGNLPPCPTGTQSLPLPTSTQVTGGAPVSTTPDQCSGPGSATVYPATVDSAVPFNPDFVVKINGMSSPVYSAKVSNYHVGGGYLGSGEIPHTFVGFTNFDVNCAATAVVTVSNRTISKAEIYPSSLGVKPTVSGNTVTIPIPKPGKYELEINGDEQQPLYLFANPVEVSVPHEGDAGVIYYGPGSHNIGPTSVGANTTVYLAPGAIVHGSLSITGDNITIRGRGILDGSLFASHDPSGYMVAINGGSHINLEGFTVRDSPIWTIIYNRTSNGIVDNVKVIAHRGNSDGLNLVSSKQIEVKNVFMRTGDDSLCVKASYGESAEDNYIHDSVMANDLSSACVEIGKEADGPSISNIRFENIDCLHTYAEAALDIGTGDWANIHDITYTNIRLENYHGFTNSKMWFTIQEAPQFWSKSGKGPGSINNITFNNVNFISGDMYPSKISGYDANHMVNGVTFNNLMVKGQKITNADQLNMSISNATNVIFK